MWELQELISKLEERVKKLEEKCRGFNLHLSAHNEEIEELKDSLLSEDELYDKYNGPSCPCRTGCNTCLMVGY